VPADIYHGVAPDHNEFTSPMVLYHIKCPIFSWSREFKGGY
jgi:hypothetical protein